MLTIKDRNDATATVWTEKEISDAVEAVARTSEGWRRDPTPLEVLRRAVQGSFELARRLPSSRVRLFGEAGFGRAEGQPQGRASSTCFRAMCGRRSARENSRRATLRS